MGVIIAKADEDNVCTADSNHEIGAILHTNCCHFVISENQLKEVKMSKITIFLSEKTSKWIKNEEKSLKSICLLCKILS